MKINVSETIYRLIVEKAKRENKRFDALVNELLNKALWNEPGLLFRGKLYYIEQDLFNSFEPAKGEIEE